MDEQSNLEGMHLSIEHSPTGVCLPPWLKQHLLEQTEVSPQLLLIHPSSAARKQAILELTKGRRGKGFTLNPDNHQTLNSLVETLIADLRVARPFSDDGVLVLIEHEAVSVHARKLGFPLLHADPERQWHLPKTERLSKLHSTLQEAGALHSWQGDPGGREFDSILKEIENKYGRSHPRLIKRELISLLNECNEPPFTLSRFKGAIMLNHDPTLSVLDRELLTAISKHLPIHQLITPGSYRLGHHGALIEDLQPCKNPEELPPWIPPHNPVSAFTLESDVSRIILEEGSDEVSAVLSILNAKESRSSERIGEQILIIDADSKRDFGSWKEVLSEAGWEVQAPPLGIIELPLIHSLRRMLILGQGDDAWSPEELLSFAENGFPMIANWYDIESHPANPEWRPRPHPELLAEVAHGLHIRGGPHALRQWRRALSEPRFEHPWVPIEQRRQAREETQWWLLCLSRRLFPWIQGSQRVILEDLPDIGCSSNQQLPLPEVTSDMYSWFDELIQNIDWQTIASTSSTSVGALRSLFEVVNRAKELVDHSQPLQGREALESLDRLIAGITQVSSRVEDAHLRVLSPSQALGCDADLAIIVGTSSEAWSVSSPTIPWLELSDRLLLGIERPDAPIRSARHLLQHMLNCATEVLVMDTSLSENPPCSPWAEVLDELREEGRNAWLSPPEYLLDKGDAITGWKLLEFGEDLFGITPAPVRISTQDGQLEMELEGPRIRDSRQAAGLLAITGKGANQVTTGSALTRWESMIMEERSGRIPAMPEGDYLNDSERGALVSTEDLSLLNRWNIPEGVPIPRLNERWPVIGRSHPKKKRTPSVDMRPIILPPVGIAAIDKRNGHDLQEPTEIRWSASRLHDWLDCPRKGWLKHRLKAAEPESFDTDMDGKLRGILVHDVLALTMAEVMGFQLGDINDHQKCPNLASAGLSLPEIMSIALRHSLQIAPWLAREDAVASHRRRSMLGLTLEELNEWEDGDGESPIILSGRLGAMLTREMGLTGSGVLSMEWELKSIKGGPSIINVEPSIEFPEDSWSFGLSGRIDRVEVLPQKDGWQRIDGKAEVVPLDLDIGDEDPSLRHIIIREIKSITGPDKGDSGKRHRKALLQEVQLALYARAWELANPGDRVVAVGVSEVGEGTKHLLEIDTSVLSEFGEELTDESTELVAPLHRRRGESHKDPRSVPFRAWLRHRLEVSGRMADAASSGQVNPTPSAKMCGYCPVKMSCGLDSAFKGGFA
ncbi:MAG: hypothetical protein CMB49_03550 [Euryarchaeota archaeon]|nr:hypothetical protein [Euryarchaeota archaeon]